MARKLDSVRRVRLETVCCRTVTYFEIGYENNDGFPYCGLCGRWAPELRVVRKVVEHAPPPASGPQQVRVLAPSSYVGVAAKSLAAGVDFGRAPRVPHASMRRTPERGGAS